VLAVLVILLFGAFSVAGCASEEPAEEPGEAEEPAEEPEEPAAGEVDAELALEEACALCRDLNRIYLQSDATDWEDVIERMDAEHAKSHPGDATLLTVEERDAIIEFMKTRTISAGEQVVREKCVECHDLANITRQAQGADWASIIDRMISQHGAELTEQEQQDALNFLMGQ
jgi:cytochrome c5